MNSISSKLLTIFFYYQMDKVELRPWGNRGSPHWQALQKACGIFVGLHDHLAQISKLLMKMLCNNSANSVSYV
jgi:hypothetical protein